jgi:2-polyprenyl-3-methyl-5-hydroxy-6-metoxy-1,4-benzoquinol methylase
LTPLRRSTVQLEIQQYLRDLDRLIEKRGVAIRSHGWSWYRPLLAIELELLTRAMRTARSVLDAGCGQGVHACFLARRGHAVTGIDGSDREVDVANALARELCVPAQFGSIGFAMPVMLARSFMASEDLLSLMDHLSYPSKVAAG